jgi:hypothetical protein
VGSVLFTWRRRSGPIGLPGARLDVHIGQRRPPEGRRLRLWLMSSSNGAKSALKELVRKLTQLAAAALRAAILARTEVMSKDFICVMRFSSTAGGIAPGWL